MADFEEKDEKTPMAPTVSIEQVAIVRPVKVREHLGVIPKSPSRSPLDRACTSFPLTLHWQLLCLTLYGALNSIISAMSASIV